MTDFNSDDLTPENFLAFCKEQPEDKDVDHGCGWNKCAIGEYVAETCGFGEEDKYEEFDFAVDTITNRIHAKYGVIYEYLNHAQGDTYGDLVNFMTGDHSVEQEGWTEDARIGTFKPMGEAA